MFSLNNQKMQFLDKVTITVNSGKGWDWNVSGRREAGVAYGWPSGWNWWKGGSVILESDKNLNTLIQYKYSKKFEAKAGEDWRHKEQYGANAEDLILKVPVWVSVFDEETKNIIHYFSTDKESFIIAKWWKWWLWNMEFTSPTLQYPNFATLWEPWHIKILTLEMQLLWDVALIWNPSVWKSTLINTISNTKAKVADYHFTTLIPHLWSVKFDDYSFNVVDIPGLIKWAAKWKWLWNDFLRHVLKARIFCIMWDLYLLDRWLKDVLDLLDEIFEYLFKEITHRVTEESEWKIKINIQVEEIWWKLILQVLNNWEVIFERLVVFVFNKYDLVWDDEIVEEFLNTFIEEIQNFNSKTLNAHKPFQKIKAKNIKKNCFVISSASHYGTSWLVKFFAEELETLQLKSLEPVEDKKHFLIPNSVRETLVKNISETEKDKLIENGYLEEFDTQYINIRQIDDPRVAELVYITQWWNDQAEMRFRNKMEEESYLDIFRDAGVMKWDVLKIKSHYAGYEDRYIQR